MKVAITGITSFIGYHLAVAFQAAGHEVIGVRGLDRSPHGVRLERLTRLQALGLGLPLLDLTDSAGIAHFIQSESPELWIQHAGYTRDYALPTYDIQRGFALNAAVLPAIYQGMAEMDGSIILTGTVAEYEDSPEPHREAEFCIPNTAYGLTKLAGTLLAQQLALRHGVPTRVVRIFLPFGPLDAPEKLLSAALRNLRAGQAMALSPCEQRRNIISASEVAALYLGLIPDFSRSPFEIYNACGDEAPSLREVLLELAGTLSADPALLNFGAIPLRPGEPEIITGSNEKARLCLEWNPRSWRESIRTFAASSSENSA